MRLKSAEYSQSPVRLSDNFIAGNWKRLLIYAGGRV
jgi:hypothetical protein